MSGRRVRALVSTRLIVALVVLAVIAAAIWITRWVRNPRQQAVPEYIASRSFVLWCPECQKEFTLPGTQAKALPKKEEGGKKLVQCPQCKKFVAVWGGRPRGESGEGVGIVQP